MTDPYAALVADLAAEHEALDAVVAPLPPEAWALRTPAEGWDVRDQIGHLHHFDGTAHQSATDPASFVAERDALIATLSDISAVDAATLAFARATDPVALLHAWRAGRAALLDALGGLDSKTRLEWYGPPMSAMSFATARLMETWAHGQDVVDAVDGHRPPTDRLRHVAHLGVRTRGFSYVVHGQEPPAGDVRVELVAPSGAEWTWGPDDAVDVVRGAALDFCLLVTQRRHRDDVALEVQGPLAESWMALAQAFAGAPGPGRPPR